MGKTGRGVRIGEVYTNRDGLDFVIVEPSNKANGYSALIRFVESGYETRSNLGRIYKGAIVDYYQKTIYGVACKGHTKCVTKLEKKAFKRWYCMIERCYNKNAIGYKSYGGKGVIVASRWLCFENFFEDLPKIEGYEEDAYINGRLELDKDLKFRDNKLYSLDTCMLVAKSENNKFMPTRQKEVIGYYKGEKYEFSNISEFARAHNIPDVGIRRAIRSGKAYKGWYFYFKYFVKIKRVTSWEDVVDAARFTINKDALGHEPSDEFKDSIMMAEHSPIRELMYVVEMYDVPCWVSQHIARHDAFAGHTVRDGASDTNFVGTSRTDRTGVNRNKLPQDAPVRHRIFLNAQDFINISQKRLCRIASKETRELWMEVIKELSKIDIQVANKCVPTCIYRGWCTENVCCGYSLTNAYQEQLKEYRNLIKPARERMK